jgi:hypothetical protein
MEGVLVDDESVDGDVLDSGGDEIEVDPDVAKELGITDEELGRQPGWKRLKMRNFAEQKREAQRKADMAGAALEEQRRVNQQLQERLQRLEQGAVAPKQEPKAEGLQGYKLEDLKDAKMKAWAAIQAVAANPEDEQARANALKVPPNLIVEIDEEIARREHESRWGRHTEESTKKEREQVARSRLQQKLVADYGNDVLDLKSGLMARAAEIFQERAKAYGFGEDKDGSQTVWAVDQAYREIRGRDRDGRGSDVDRRRLAVEGQVRRETQVHNAIAALKGRGDLKSAVKATEIELDQWLGANGYTVQGQ